MPFNVKKRFPEKFRGEGKRFFTFENAFDNLKKYQKLPYKKW